VLPRRVFLYKNIFKIFLNFIKKSLTKKNIYYIIIPENKKEEEK